MAKAEMARRAAVQARFNGYCARLSYHRCDSVDRFGVLGLPRLRQCGCKTGRMSSLRTVSNAGRLTLRPPQQLRQLGDIDGGASRRPEHKTGKRS